LEGVDVETASHEEILAALDKELEDLQRCVWLLRRRPTWDPSMLSKICVLIRCVPYPSFRLQATRTESKLERDRLQREVRAWKATLESSDVMLRDYAKVRSLFEVHVCVRRF
jgi:hypothetical protein